MKKLLFLLGAISVIGLSSYSVDNLSANSQVNATQEYECNYGQCQATAKSTGKRCKHCVSNRGDRYCYQHKG